MSTRERPPNADAPPPYSHRPTSIVRSAYETSPAFHDPGHRAPASSLWEIDDPDTEEDVGA